MKKIQLLGILMTLLISSLQAQTDCSELKSKNEKLISELTEKNGILSVQKERIEKLESEINYYKETLNLLNSKITGEGNNVIFKINSVKGKTDLGKIIIEGLIENKGAVGKFQSKSIELTDPQGNIYKSSKVSFGGESYLPQFQKNLPVKVQIEFDKIIDESPIMKAMVWSIYGGQRFGASYTVIFKNLAVEWE
ncbi:hypothetical protein [Croceivirga sp. JEA036]|uniref:hypothetical protein n=1 Tax=Croceivirga sp. JEA036 TaxID=2721162 RepID=UPI001438747D|nr:hypothetical protein [Croceivirga sp. JEA036]NJB35291.1 hypothetical protein [Croceivirga sp. JEA036]